MTIKEKVLGIVAILALASSFEAGVHSVDISTSKVDTINIDHKKTTIVVVKKPDGSSTTTETIDEKSKTKTDAISQIPVKTNQKTNISVLVGNDFSRSVVKPIYGISVNRELIGPVTVGAYGLTSGIIGLSIGVNF